VKTTIGVQVTQQLNSLENKDTHGVEEGHNTHGNGNEWMSLRMVCTENTETRRARWIQKGEYKLELVQSQLVYC
jgi:hypothetical protein